LSLNTTLFSSDALVTCGYCQHRRDPDRGASHTPSSGCSSAVSRWCQPAASRVSRESRLAGQGRAGQSTAAAGLGRTGWKMASSEMPAEPAVAHISQTSGTAAPGLRGPPGRAYRIPEAAQGSTPSPGRRPWAATWRRWPSEAAKGRGNTGRTGQWEQSDGRAKETKAKPRLRRLARTQRRDARRSGASFGYNYLRRDSEKCVGPWAAKSVGEFTPRILSRGDGGGRDWEQAKLCDARSPAEDGRDM
jgi:hypothetical protein